MNLQFYLEKLFASEKFQSFMKENPSAYFCSGFFSIDRQRENPLTTSSKRGQSKEDKGNKIHIDYIIPETKKIFSFHLENEIKLLPVERIGENLLEPIGTQRCTPNTKGMTLRSLNIQKNIFTKGNSIDFDFEEIEKMIVEKMDEQKMKNKIQKILLSLQNKDGKDFLIGTVFISGLGMIKIKIDLEEMGIIEFEKKSFFDMMKIVGKKK